MRMICDIKKKRKDEKKLDHSFGILIEIEEGEKSAEEFCNFKSLSLTINR
jgi:hypothetical protein